VQTPQQRKANQKFAKDLQGKMGKPSAELKKKQEFKSPISPFWLGALPLPSGLGISALGDNGMGRMKKETMARANGIQVY